MFSRLLSLCLFATLAFPARAGEKPKDSPKPNFVFILIDDLGWTDLGCYGSKFYHTPNIDRLAAKGMRFTCAYTAASICSPTRASIMTGKHPARIGMTNFLIGNRWPENAPLVPIDWTLELSTNEITLARALKMAGYVTGMVGKWHLGKTPPEAYGFDSNVDGTIKGSPPGYFDKKGTYLVEKHTAAAEKFIETNKDRPFFLYLAHYTVHIPLQAKKELIAKYQAKANENPVDKVYGEDKGKKVRIVQNHPVYAAMIESMDESVGRIVKKLEDLKIDDRTVIVFFSDNGGLVSAEGEPTSVLPLRLGKGWLYEGGVRVPCIIYWPGHTRRGSTAAVPIVSTDFYPTMLEMAGLRLNPKQHSDGLSLVPLLQGRGPPERKTFYWHYPHYSNQGGTPSGAVRHGDLKLIEYYEDGTLELYDLKNDLGEKNNLAAKMPKQAQELRQMLETWRREVGATMPKRKKS